MITMPLTRETMRVALMAAALICGCARRERAAPSDSLATGTVRAVTRSAIAAGDVDTARGASGSDRMEYYTAAALSHVADSLARGAATGHRLGVRDNYQYLVIRRPQSGGPEVHDHWSDVTVVQAGRGTLVSGGRLAGGRLEADGEHRGGTIEGGASRPVGAGDLMIIPAGMPHQYLIAAGDTLRYLTIKVLREPRAR